jgi:hypothetical protein
MDALTRMDLDGRTCEVPGCTHAEHTDAPLILSPMCHPAASLSVDYRSGVLTMRCARCAQMVTRVKVAIA